MEGEVSKDGFVDGKFYKCRAMGQDWKFLVYNITANKFYDVYGKSYAIQYLLMIREYEHKNK